MSAEEFLGFSQSLTVAGRTIVECPLCSAMIPVERQDRHARIMHPGWRMESGGPDRGTVD